MYLLIFLKRSSAPSSLYEKLRKYVNIQVFGFEVTPFISRTAAASMKITLTTKRIA